MAVCFAPNGRAARLPRTLAHQPEVSLLSGPLRDESVAPRLSAGNDSYYGLLTQRKPSKENDLQLQKASSEIT